MQKNKFFVLWLPSWYPNKLKPYDGDFVQRHAQAAALYNNIYVIKVVSDEKGSITKNVKTEIDRQGNLTEHIVYYKKSGSLFGRIIAAYNAIRLYRQAIKNCIMQNGKPRLVHVHVSIMAGLLALWIKRKYRIHFILTEHWAGFSPEAKKNFDSLPFYLQVLWKRVMNNAIAISVVSSYLGELLKKQFSIKNYIIIPNVVNTEIFYPINKISSLNPRFIHVSGLDYQKNPEDILRAFSIVKKSFTDFQLDIFGPAKKNLVEMVNDLQLQQQVKLHYEVPQNELAKCMSQSDALILYSRYESFGCVIIEANACGIPVLVSDLPVFHETIKHGINGLFSRGNNPAYLATTIKDFIEKKYQFDNMSIAEDTSSKYNYQLVGKQFDDWYEKVIDSLNHLK
jgi:glycosyltransferase involved in cell wall biosynthesis